MKPLAGMPPLSTFDKSHFCLRSKNSFEVCPCRSQGSAVPSAPGWAGAGVSSEPEPEALKLKMCRLCSSTPAQKTPSSCYFWIPRFFRAAGNKSSRSWLPSNKERWISAEKALPWTTQGLLQSWEPEVAKCRGIFFTQLQLHEAKSPRDRSRVPPVRGVIMRPGWLICIELNHIQVTGWAPNLDCNMFPSRTQHVSGIQIEIAFFFSPLIIIQLSINYYFFKPNNSLGFCSLLWLVGALLFLNNLWLFWRVLLGF